MRDPNARSAAETYVARNAADTAGRATINTPTRTFADMAPDTDPPTTPSGTGFLACSPHLHRSEDGGGQTGQTPESAARNASETGPAATGAPAPADAAADTDLTPPAGRPDTAVGPRRDAWHDRGPTEGRFVLTGEPMVAARAANAGTIKTLVGQRKVARMMRTKSQQQADRYHRDAEALTTALAALGHQDADDA